MAFPWYLAMTAAEFSAASQLPPHIGWLSCHFSSSGAGLSNLPQILPPQSLLILDDSIPMAHHDKEEILSQLKDLVKKFSISGILLDFQRKQPGENLGSLSFFLQDNLPCPVVAPPAYSRKSNPIFLPPAPLHQPLAEYLAPHRNREIWLDAARLTEKITVTETGSHWEFSQQNTNSLPTYYDPLLHCSYRIQVEDGRIIFSLQRDENNIAAWAEEARKLGVHAIVGLYQEWK